MTKTDITSDLGAMTTQGEYDDVTVEDLQELVDNMTNELRSAKQAFRDKRFAGVNAAVIARKEADVELTEELRKLGYAGLTTGRLPHSTVLRNLYSIAERRF